MSDENVGSYGSAFFRRQSTISAIEAIRQRHRLVIYAGAGVTIDKSDLGWSALIEGLLKPHVPSRSARRRFVRQETPLFAASAAAQFFLESSDEADRETDARQRIVDTLRPMMYGPGTWRSGDLAPAIADFVYLWNTTGVAGTVQERCACIVTTNYDDYIYSALKVAYQARSGRLGDDEESLPAPKPAVVFASDLDPLVNELAEPAHWIESNQYPCRDEAGCIHLHGFVPKNPREAGVEFRQPVVSENDYYRSAGLSETALESVFRNADVIIAGASVTDAPLIRALEATADNGRDRFCMVGLTPPESSSGADFFNEQRRMITARLIALNVRPIFLDYHVQHAQFFRELAAAAELGPRSRYDGDRQHRNYYARLGRWWSELGITRSRQSSIDMQWEVHEELVETLMPQVQAALSSAEERLKIELWLRWDPVRDREFRLFGSSVGVWATEQSMRAVSISSGGNLIVDAFREGRPMLREANTGPEVRWATWLAVPIWSESHERAFVSSVMVLASRSKMSASSLNEQRNRAAIASCVDVLRQAGSAITDPTQWSNAKP